LKKSEISLYLLFFLFLNYFGFAQEKDIREDVNVVNVEVPVRVIFKGKPVDNLKKSDFRLFENGKEQRINGFYMVRKKIEGQRFDLSSGRTQIYKPRYFVLAFRIYSVTKPLTDSLKYFFKKILKPSDQLLLFINDKTLYFNSVKDKSVLIDIIRKYMKNESLKAKFRFEKAFQKIRSDLMQARNLSNIGGRNSSGERPMSIMRAKRFVENYSQILKEYRRLFLTPDIGVYYNFARYLEKIDIEKWVIIFYQFEKFPTIKISGRLRRELGDAVDSIDRMVEMVDEFPSKEIAKIFYKVNATFHTLFFTTYEDINSRDIELKTISTDLENSFREITKKTGGELVISNKLDISLEKIVEKEDIYYMLTYSPNSSGKAGKIKVKIDNSNYKVYYDDNIRADYITYFLKKRESEVTTVKLNDLIFDNKRLTFSIKDIMRRKSGKLLTGKVKVHISIKSSSGIELFNKSKVMNAEKNKVRISIGIKWLKSGKYDLIVDVLDILTGKSAFEYKRIEVK